MQQRRARLILIVGFLFALIAGGGTFVIASSSKTDTPVVVPTTPVLVAAREIPAKTTLTAADVKVVQYNVDSKPAAALTKQEDAITKVTTQAISVGEPMLPGKFADPKTPSFVVIPASFIGDDGAPQPGSPNFRAMSITVPDSNAVGGAVTPGDVVDVLFTLNFDPVKFLQKPTPQQGQDFSAKIILERVPILAKLGSVYTIRVEAGVAEQIAYLQSSGGQLSFLLRAPKDERASGSVGATFGAVLKSFRFVIPEKVTP